MPEISDEQFEKLQRAEAADERTKANNRSRTKAIAQLIEAHKPEFDRLFEAAKQA